jgi:phytoene dehydrogenase-like protein
MLEKNDYLGGATTSQKVFRDYDAYLSRYSYLVSLFPDKIVKDLGLRVTFRRRAVASFTPYLDRGRQAGLLLSNVSQQTSRDSMRALTGSDREFDQLQKFYYLARIFAEQIWDTMLAPLPSKVDLRKRFQQDELPGEAWRALIEVPLGETIEKYLSHDLVRGLVLTDAKIGVLTHAHDPSLLQNRCFLYHLIGNKTGEWKVPVGGMGSVAAELVRVATERGAEMITRARITALDLVGKAKTVEVEVDGKGERVQGRFVLINFGPNVLAPFIGKTYQPDATHEGSVFKINMLCRKLPNMKAPVPPPTEAFAGTFHAGEGYEEMQASYQRAVGGQMPERLPCELYCHTLTDDTILSPELRAQGYHTLTLFGLDAPWRLFTKGHDDVKANAEEGYLKSLNQWLAEPIQACLATDRSGQPCLESKSPIDIEKELGHYRGNIFHSALQFPFAESTEEEGQWGVETQFENVFICGASARRGGAVSGIPGHNVAMKVLQILQPNPAT